MQRELGGIGTKAYPSLQAEARRLTKESETLARRRISVTRQRHEGLPREVKLLHGFMSRHLVKSARPYSGDEATGRGARACLKGEEALARRRTSVTRQWREDQPRR